MKKILSLALILCSISALAQTSTGTAGQHQNTTTNTTSAAGATSNNAGNSQSIIFTAPADSTSTANVNYAGGTSSAITTSGTTTVRNVPSVNGQALVSSNDTCMGSLSGSLNVAGFGGSLGSTYKDANCVILKNAREFWNMGMRAAALALMCQDANNADALALTGFECPQTTRDRKNADAKAAQNAAVASPEITDPIVRTRLNLPPLAK